MRKYRGILIAVAASLMLAACAGKTDGPAKEKLKENTESSVQQDKRKPDIQILEDPPAAAQPETSPLESMQAPEAEHAGQKTGETQAAGSTAAKETESASAYSVVAVEKTMYTTTNVNVRTSYTTKSEAIAILTPGKKVKITGRSANGWMRIVYNGKDAFVYQKYLSDSAPKLKQAGTKSNRAETESTPAKNHPVPGATTYPENTTEDMGEIPIVEPAPINTTPGQGSSVTQSGPGVVSPGVGNGQNETAAQGTGPGM